MSSTIRLWFDRVLLLALPLRGISCKEDVSHGSSPTVELRAWAHAGRQAARRVIEAQVQPFNGRHPEVQVQLTLLPEGSYNSQVCAAALAGELPDLLEYDGPLVYNDVWQGHLIPPDGLSGASWETSRGQETGVRGQRPFKGALGGSM